MGTGPGVYPEHDLFILHMKLKKTLRQNHWAKAHLGLDYYGE